MVLVLNWRLKNGKLYIMYNLPQFLKTAKKYEQTKSDQKNQTKMDTTRTRK